MTNTVTNGIEQSEKETLKKLIMSNFNAIEDKIAYIDPGICIELSFNSIENNSLVNPSFVSFKLDQDWEVCTWDKLILDNTKVHNELKITHADKIIWKNPYITKENYLGYLTQISPFILPFLRNKTLTTIRYPEGIHGQSFYQKKCPDYAPSFIKTQELEGINYIICNDLSTLLWLGNQLAIEYHIPFQTINSAKPTEIVIDLDPPDHSSFSLAIKAANEIKKVLESLNIVSFPKLSGSKGIQIHIPIFKDSLTYDETRLFTSFIANYLVEKFPNYFTIERMKSKRGNRLYIDYVQFAKGKTIICPYSTRGKENATVAAPLYWEEVNENLRKEDYNIPFVLNRISNNDCPMSKFFEQKNTSLINIISSIKENVYG